MLRINNVVAANGGLRGTSGERTGGVREGRPLPYDGGADWVRCETQVFTSSVSCADTFPIKGKA